MFFFKDIFLSSMKCITNFDVSNTHHELGNEIKLYHFLVRKGYCMFVLLFKNKCNTHHQPDFLGILSMYFLRCVLHI